MYRRMQSENKMSESTEKTVNFDNKTLNKSNRISGDENNGVTNGEVDEKIREDVKKENSLTVLGWMWRLGVLLIAGILFGIALEKSRVFEPRSIRLQMVFQRWIMLKMFLAALATGQLCFTILSLIPVTRTKFEKVCDNYVAGFATKGLLTSTLGPFILGCGMTLSGACPSMVLAQVGAWTHNSILTLVGALIGTLVYGMLAPFIIRLTRPRNPTIQIHQIHTKLKLRFVVVALPMAVVVAAVVVLLEWFIPWTKDLDIQNEPGTNIATARAWPPFAGGMLVGVLQVLIVLAVDDSMGGSSSYVTVMSQWVVTKNYSNCFHIWPNIASVWAIGGRYST